MRARAVLALVKDWLFAEWLTFRYVVPLALGVIGVWAYACIGFGMPNPLRSLMLWGIIAGLTVGSATLSYIQKKKLTKTKK